MSIFFLSSVSYSLESKSFASLGRFVPKYFTNFDVMVNGIVSLISVSSSVIVTV